LAVISSYDQQILFWAFNTESTDINQQRKADIQKTVMCRAEFIVLIKRSLVKVIVITYFEAANPTQLIITCAGIGYPDRLDHMLNAENGMKI